MQILALLLLAASEVVDYGVSTEGKQVETVQWLVQMSAISFENLKNGDYQPNGETDVVSVPAPRRKATDGCCPEGVPLTRYKIVWEHGAGVATFVGNYVIDPTRLVLDEMKVNALPVNPKQNARGLWQPAIKVRPEALLKSDMPIDSIQMWFETPTKAAAVRDVLSSIGGIWGTQSHKSDAQEPEPWPPVDEGVMSPSFNKFRSNFIEIVRRKDIDALMAVVDPEIKLSFGGDNGIERFREMLQPDSPEYVRWKRLEEILANGGMFFRDSKMYLSHEDGFIVRTGVAEPGFFIAPYWFHAPGDGFENIVIIKKDVPVKREPRDHAETIGKLSHEVVPITQKCWEIERLTGQPYVEIKYHDAPAYVRKEDIRSIIGYRAGFQRTSENRWVMTFFLAGD